MTSEYRRPAVAVAALALVTCGILVWREVRRDGHASAPAGPPRFVDVLDVQAFSKGNLHAHSTRSDGDASPEDVVAWYRDHGYAFLALTDHDQLVDPTELAQYERPGFTLVPGEEITSHADGHPVHVNALCHKSTIGSRRFDAAGDALRWAIERVREQGGVALVNHPNFDWALSTGDLRHAAGAALLEIRSGHPHVNTDGDVLRPSHEAMWDAALSDGLSFAPAGVDDVHHLGAAPDEKKAGPGRAWVETFGGDGSRGAICGELARGRLYASTGARFVRIAVGGDELSVWPDGSGARVEMIVQKGEVVATLVPAPGEPARYRLRGSERYVRARVTMPDGGRAWTPAFRVTR